MPSKNASYKINIFQQSSSRILKLSERLVKIS
jgi:hypothetical protein